MALDYEEEIDRLIVAAKEGGLTLDEVIDAYVRDRHASKRAVGRRASSPT